MPHDALKDLMTIEQEYWPLLGENVAAHPDEAAIKDRVVDLIIGSASPPALKTRLKTLVGHLLGASRGGPSTFQSRLLARL